MFQRWHERPVTIRYCSAVGLPGNDAVRQELITEVSTGELLKAIRWPGSGGESDIVSYAHSSQGELIRVTDQSGNVLEHLFDTAGRVTEWMVSYSKCALASSPVLAADLFHKDLLSNEEK